MNLRECSMAGCTKPELCGVGPLNEPMCEEHYNAWLAATRRTFGAMCDAFNAFAHGGDGGEWKKP